MDQTKATYLPISGLTLFTGVGLLGVILLVVFGLINEYRNSIHYAHTEVKTLTRLLEGHASATVDKVDLLLREVQKSVHPEDMRLPPGAIPSRRKEWHQLLKSLLEHVPEAEVIHISNVTGDHIYSSIDPLPSINIIDRYHFTRQRDDPLAGLVMSPALRSRTTGKWTLVLTRRLNFEDGRFAGIINVVLKPEYFQQFYQTLDLNSHGLVALYDESWHLLARYPAGGKDLGKKIDLDAGTPVEKEASQSSFIARSPLDGVKRIYSYRKVGQLPLYVLSAIAEDDYLAEWQRHVWQYSLGTLIFCVVVISFSWRQRRANKALRHSEENLRIIADHTYDWEYWEGAEHDIRYMSPACQRVTGYAPQEFINNPALIHQIVHPDDRHVLEAHSHVSPSDLAEISFRIIRRDGGIRWITHGCQAVYGKSNQYLGRRVCNRDETERKKLELMTKEFEAIVQSSNDAVIGKSLDGIITSWNHGAEALFGYSAEEMIGSHMNRLFPVDRIDEENFILKHIAAGKTVQHLETVRVHKSGKLIDISVTFSPIHDNNGKVIGISKVARDITDHKKAESALRRASLYARSLIEASLDPLVTISPEGKITDVNRATEAVTGHLREELIGSDFSSYFTDPSEASRGYQKVFSEGRVKDYPLAIRHVSGAVTEVLYNANLYRTETGEVAGVFAAARDITERKQAEEALRRASLYARSLIEASLDPLVTISPEGKITDVNRATEAVTGRLREELIGSDFSSYFTDPGEASRGYQKVFSEGSVKDYPLAIRHVSGTITEVLYNASLYRNEAGEVAGIFAAARDITERKKAEDEIKHLAFFDPLTKLANRRMLHEHLKQAMAASKRNRQYGAVMLLDLDNFKPLNDLHGHDAGDLLLVEVARRLKSCVRETDTVARVGGDEFVVLVGQLNTDPTRSAAEAAMTAEKIRAILAQPYTFSIEHEGAAASRVEHHCTASIGVALFRGHEFTQDDVLKRADTAMYQAKESGRDMVRFYP